MLRCGCGARLGPEQYVCRTCGFRPQPVAARVPAMAGRGHSIPTPIPTPVPTPVPAPMFPPRPLPAVVGPRSNSPWIVAGVSVAVALLLGAIGIVASLRPAPTTVAVPTPVASPTVTVGVPVVARAWDGTVGDTGSSSGTSATTTLEDIAAADRSTVDGVVGSWVPQLSAKREGTVADGITYDDAAILAHYASLAGRFPSAALLYSGDWPVFGGSDYWVVVYPQAFPTAAAANAWCDAQGLSADDCFAKRLSLSGGSAGTTAHR